MWRKLLAGAQTNSLCYELNGDATLTAGRRNKLQTPRCRFRQLSESVRLLVQNAPVRIPAAGSLRYSLEAFRQLTRLQRRAGTSSRVVANRWLTIASQRAVSKLPSP